MSILVNKPASVAADSVTSLEINKNDLQSLLVSLNAGDYWEDENTWKGAAFLFENANKQRTVAVFNFTSGVNANLPVSEFFVDGNILCKRITIIGFANDSFTILRNDFTTANEFDIEITGGYESGGGGGPSLTTVELYHFDGSGNGAYGNNFTQFGTLVYNPGKFSLGVGNFSLNSAYLKRDAGFLSPIGSGDFTIEFWAKLNEGSSQTAFAIINDGIPGIVPTEIKIGFRYNGNGQWFDYLVDGNLVLTIDASGKKDNNWHHVVLQRNTGVLRGFIDGVFVSSVNYATSVPSSGYELSVGRTGWSSPSYWEGSIDELRISNAAVYNIAGFTPPSVPLT